MNAEMTNARPKFVNCHASAKLLKLSGDGRLNPVPDAACSDVLSAIATVKYMGSSTASDASASSPVSRQLTR